MIRNKLPSTYLPPLLFSVTLFTSASLLFWIQPLIAKTLLLLSIGLPFFIISASSPLFQSWFSRFQHHWAVDPYFLFATSNAGSLIALVAFPLVLEPSFGLNEQYKLWRVGFAVLVILTCAIALALRPLAIVPIDARQHKERNEDVSHKRVSAWRRLRWVALSFVPSSLMLGVTTYITTDVAAVNHTSCRILSMDCGRRCAGQCV